MTWSDVVVPRPELGAAVFEVADGHRRSVRAWAEGLGVPAASTRMVHTPSVDAWAVLDGGVTALYGFGITTLDAGVRVVGFGALRLLLHDLGVPAPDVPFPGERPHGLDLVALRLRHRSPAARGDAAQEQAELLAACTEAAVLRWVAAALADPLPADAAVR